MALLAAGRVQMAQDLSLAASCARPLFARLASPRYRNRGLRRRSSLLCRPSYRRLKLARASGRARAFVLPKNFVSDSQKRSRLFLGFAGGSKTPGRTRDAPLLPEVYHRVSLSHGHPTFRPFRIPLNSSDPGWLAKPHHPSPNLRERRERRQRSLQPWERSAAR